jgi:hypothetical protein
MSTAPQLSILVVCQNPGARPSGTLESLRQQRQVETEIVVVERGSAGANVVEPLNAAVAAARGEWVFFFQPGDRLVGDMVLSETLNWMKKTECGVVAGESAANDGRIQNLRAHANPIAGDFAPRSATFYRRGLFEENGDFDPALPAMAHYELNVRLWKNRIRFKPIPLRIAACEADGIFDWPAAREEMRVRHRYYPAWRCWPWDLKSMLRAARRGRPARRQS